MPLYIDVLIILNIYVNYFLLKATAKFTHSDLRFGRAIVSSLFGSLFSLTILLPNLHPVLNLLLKFAAAAFIVAAAFGTGKGYARLLLYFFGINFIFAGVMFTMYLLLKPPFMRYNNYYVYIDFSLAALVVFTVAAYAGICLVRYLMDKSKTDGGKYSIIIRRGEKTISVDGLADTGNILSDSFTGKSVIICGRQNANRLFENGISGNADDYISNPSEIPKGVRLIPYTAVNESGIIPIFKPDEVIIRNEYTRVFKKVDALIGVNENNICAIFNPKLLC